MLKIVSATVLAAGLVASLPFAANATDIQVKAPHSAYNWAGAYVGANIGYGWGRGDGDFTFAQPVGTPGISQFATGTSNSADGVLGGIQFGYNWQTNNVIYGLEADLQASGQKSTATVGGLIPGVGFGPGGNPLTLSTTERLDWLSTVRGRLGLINGSSLLYATGGLAIGKVSTSGVFAPDPAAAGPNTPGVWSGSEIRLGWTIGAGIESAISSKWSWKAEYLYVNLGDFSGASSIPNSNCYGTPGVCDITAGLGSTNLNHKFTDNIVRVGLNYKLN